MQKRYLAITALFMVYALGPGTICLCAGFEGETSACRLIPAENTGCCSVEPDAGPQVRAGCCGHKQVAKAVIPTPELSVKSLQGSVAVPVAIFVVPALHISWELTPDQPVHAAVLAYQSPPGRAPPAY